MTAEEASAADAIGALASGSSVGWLPEALRPCNSADLVRLVMCMGMFLSDWRRERRIETLSAAGADAVAGVAMAGIRALQQWPIPLHDFLVGEAKSANMRPGRYGAQKSLGSFYTWLRDVEEGPVRNALLEVTRFVVGSDPVLARRVHRSDLLAQGNAPGILVGLVEAARVLNKSQAGVKRLLASGQLPAAVSEGRGVPMTIDRAAVRKLAAIRSGMLTLEQLARKLNVSKTRTRALIAAGHIKNAKAPREANDGPWEIDEFTVDRWLQGIEGCRAVSNDAPMVTFEYAARAFLHRQMGVDRVLDSVVAGNLPIAGVDEAAIGLKRLMFSKSAVQAICRATSSGPVVTLQTVSLRLGIKREMAAHLLKRGLIESLDGGVSEESVCAFQERFVSGASLARSRGTSSRALSGVLAAQGVMPVTGPGIDGGRQTFYARSEVESPR